jgi:hypothetical protein
VAGGAETEELPGSAASGIVNPGNIPDWNIPFQAIFWCRWNIPLQEFTLKYSRNIPGLAPEAPNFFSGQLCEIIVRFRRILFPRKHENAIFLFCK